MPMKISKRQMSVLGHVGKDPKRMATPGGTSVVEFSVASTYSKKVNENYVDETEWTNCKMFGDRVDTFMKYVSSGIRIEVEGHFRTEQYEKDGSTRYKHYLIVDTYIPLSKKNENSAPANANAEGNLEIPTS